MLGGGRGGHTRSSNDLLYDFPSFLVGTNSFVCPLLNEPPVRPAAIFDFRHQHRLQKQHALLGQFFHERITPPSPSRVWRTFSPASHDRPRDSPSPLIPQ